MKPIETKYKGYSFRSRLEARWAVFFDALNLKWEYEPEGFEMSDGTKYLPDFKVWYPGRDASEKHQEWYEVKSSLKEMSKEEWLKLLKFQKESGSSIIILDGCPEEKMYACASEAIEVLFNKEDQDSTDMFLTVDQLIDAVVNEKPLKINDEFKRAGNALLCHKGRTWWDSYELFWEDSGWGQEELKYACQKARSARFEHGRNGN